MSNSAPLAELEYVVLIALARLGDQAYGMAIHDEIEQRTGRDLAIGSVYTVLDRLQKKGYVTTRLGEPTQERGGRAKRFFDLEHAGAMALTHAQRMHASLWEGLEVDPEAYR